MHRAHKLRNFMTTNTRIHVEQSSCFILNEDTDQTDYLCCFNTYIGSQLSTARLPFCQIISLKITVKLQQHLLPYSIDMLLETNNMRTCLMFGSGWYSIIYHGTH